MNKGDWINTPRFLKVKIAEVLTRAEAYDAGYTEPTHYRDDPDYDIYGKNSGEYRMVFAAVRKV